MNARIQKALGSKVNSFDETSEMKTKLKLSI